VAAEAGDIVFMGDPLKPLPLLVRLSRETVRIIRQNILIFAFAVNAVGIVLTAWIWPLVTPAGWYEEGPIAAVIYHQLGSLAVLLNSMRLLWFERSSTSPATDGGGFLKKIETWLEKHFDVGEWVHWVEHHGKRVLAALGVLLLVIYALSGLTLVRADEMAVVRRFGRPVEDLEPGLYWRWPWPIEDTVRVSRRLRTVEIGFRAAPGKAIPKAQGWTTVHPAERRDEALMITGDDGNGNLVELQATVTYRVIDPRLFLFQVRDPDEIIRAATESVLRGLVAGRPFLDLLTIKRDQFQKDALARLEKYCRDFSPLGLGIAFDSLALKDMHPPAEVVPYYYNVAKAMEAYNKTINQAQASKRLKEAAAEAEAHQIVLRAEAAKKEKIRQAEADRITFLTKSAARKDLDFEHEVNLCLDGVHAVLAGGNLEDVERRRQDMIQAQATLTDFRLFWDTLSRALTGRDLILIDADKVPGRRTLLLFDPDQFRVPVPMLLPREREPPARGPLPKQKDGEP
jgi:Cu+-exporting ATPase